MRKVLILPSWYPSPDDKVSGSFFQEQAKLVSDRYEIKVLLVRFVGRPSVRAFMKTPVNATRDWLNFIFQPRVRTKLPEDQVFSNPPLVEYKARNLDVTQRRRYQKALDTYLAAFDELLATGWKPDLVHAHSVNFGGLAAKRIKEVHGIPYVITEHMPFVLSNYPEHMRHDIRLAFDQSSFVLSLGYDMIRQFGISGISVEPNFIYNLVDELLFKNITSQYSPGTPLRIISVGAASHYKDHFTLLHALLILKSRSIPFHLTLIGLRTWGDQYEKTIEFIRNNNLLSDVNVIDRATRDEVSHQLPRHHIFIMTSLFETFCVSMIEAMACGLTVISTRHGGGATEMVTNKVGRLVNIKDHYEIANHVEQIFNGNLSFEPIAIRNHVVSICGRKAFSQRLSSYYERAMDMST